MNQNLIHSARGPVFLLAAWMLAALPSTAAAQAPAGNAAETEKLIGTLQSPSASRHDKSVACERLAVIGTPEAVPVLAALLTDEELSHMARYALEPMPGTEPDAALRAALGNVNGRLRVGVIHSIGVRRDAQAVPALKQELSSADSDIVAAAAGALGRIANAEAAASLRQSLASAPSAARAGVANGCLVCAETMFMNGQGTEAGAMYEAVRDADVSQPAKVAAFRGMVLTHGADGVTLLVDELKSPRFAYCAMALRTARELPGADVTRTLAMALAGLPEDRKPLLIQVLGDRGDKAAVPVLLEAAKSGATPVRVAALRALATTGDASLVPFLLETATNTNPDISKAARAALLALPGSQTDAVIVTRINNGEGSIRRVAIEISGQRGIGTAMPQLLRATEDSDAAIRTAAIKAIGETADAADLAALAGLIVKSSSSSDLGSMAQALESTCSRITDKHGSTGTLLAFLPPAGPKAKAVLLGQLGQLGGSAGLEAVRAGMQDSNPDVSAAAFRALAEWPDAGAAPDLVAIVRTTQDGERRNEAFAGWVRIIRESDLPNDQRFKMLAEAMVLATDGRQKKLVLAGLGDVPVVDSLKLAVSLLSDAALADEAGAAVVKIAGKLDASSKAEVAPALSAVLKSSKARPVLDEANKQMKRLGIKAD